MDDLVQKTIGVISALRQRDENTASHSGRVSRLCVETGRACGLSSHELTMLGLSAELHDVGKIGIPDSILLKPGRLDDEEMQVMRTHPRRGYDMLINIPNDAIAGIADVVLHHHETYDGTGYPDKLRGDAIPVAARILSVADAYDALATVRPYHGPRSHTSIMDMFEERACKYDPAVLAAFSRIIDSSDYKSPVA